MHFGRMSIVAGEIIISAQPLIDFNLYDFCKMAAVEGSHWTCEELTLMFSINEKLSEFKLNSSRAGNI